MSLDTLANVKARLGITTSADDTLLGLLQNSADAWVSNHCGRDFGGGTYTEYHPGGSEFIHLRNFPVQSVTSVNFDPGYVFGSGTILSSTSYVVHTDRGVIQSLVGPFAPRVDRQGLVNRHVYNWTKGPRVLQVIYTVAAAAPPDDLLGAYALLIGHWYRLIKTQVAVNFQNIRQQKFGDAFTTYNAAESGGLPIPPDVYLLLAAHRVPNL
jgi:hypothetical protein